MQPHRGDLEHVGLAERVPGVHHAVVAEGDRDALALQLRHAGLAAALGVGVVAALDDDVDQRVGDRRDARFGHQRQELRDVVVVHRMHRGEVRARRPVRRARAAASRRRASRYGATSGRRSRRNACRRGGRASPRSRRARRRFARRRPWCARNGGCRRRCRRRGRARGRGSAPRSASGSSRPAGRRRAAGRDRAPRVFFTSRSASTASRRSSQTSTWVRIASSPWLTARSQ